MDQPCEGNPAAMNSSVEPSDPKAPRFFNSEGRFLASMAALALLKFWLVGWQEVAAQGSARFDDYLFVELGNRLRNGDWLGPYDELTLVKGPVYPMWLAVVALLRLPLLPAQHALYTAAAAILVLVIGRAIPHRGARLALFAVLLFDPATYESSSHRVTREGIYTSLTVLVFAAAAAIALHPKIRRAAIWGWAVFLGIALSLFWFTREEGPWIVLAVAIPLLYAAIQRLHAAHAWQRLFTIVPLAVPLLILVTAHVAFAQINKHYYGTAATIELREPWFTRAYGSLTRVDPDHAMWRVPVSASARAQIYTASPAFAELEPHLEWKSRMNNLPDADSPAPREEMTGTWFIWAFRDAVAAAGHHDSLAHARDYYVRLADEVNAACAEGRLACGPPHASLAPAWRPEYVERCWRFLRPITHNVLSMRAVHIEQLPSELNTPEALEHYKAVTHMRIDGVNKASSEGTRFLRIGVLQSIASIYKICLYPAVVVSVVIFLAGLVRDIRARMLSPQMLLAAAALGAVLTRIALLTYISAGAYPIFHFIYLRVLYPLLYVFIALCAAYAIQALRRPVPTERS